MKKYQGIWQITAVFVLVAYLGYAQLESDVPAQHQFHPPKVNDHDEYGAFQNARSFELPTSFEFAGEQVPLHIPDVSERFDRELMVNMYWHSSTLGIMKRANRFLPLIDSILKENKIPLDFRYLPLIESKLMNVRSPVGAAGFWQIMEKTGKEHGLIINDEVDERYHAIKSTEVACAYLNSAHQMLGSWTSAAASYNIGMGGLRKRLHQQNTDSYYDLYLNSETYRYVFRLLAIKEIMENPSKYGFYLDKTHLYESIPTYNIRLDTSVSNLIDLAESLDINYKTLKLYNPWLRTKSLTITPPIKCYEITIPYGEDFRHMPKMR